MEHRCDLPRCKFHVQKKLKLVPGNEAARSSPLAKVHNLCPRRHITGVATIDLIAIGDQQSCSLMKKVQNCFSRRNDSPHNEPQHCTTNQDEIVLNHPYKNCFVLLKAWCLWRIFLVCWISPRPWTLLWPPAAMLKAGGFLVPGFLVAFLLRCPVHQPNVEAGYAISKYRKS